MRCAVGAAVEWVCASQTRGPWLLMHRALIGGLASGFCRRGFNLIGKIQPVLIGWNLPDEVERWHNQAVEVPTVGAGVLQTSHALRPVHANPSTVRTAAALLAPRDSDPEGVQQRAHLRFGLGQLGVRVGVRHDAGTSEKAQARARRESAAQRDRKLAVPGRVHPAHGP